MKTQEYYAYDVYLENHDICLAKYQVSDENITDERGKTRTYRSYSLLEVDVPSDIKEAIQSLSLSGFYPVQKFRDLPFAVSSLNPLINAKLFLLGMNHRLLEKTYRVINRYDQLYIAASITYIHMNTGEIRSMDIGSFLLSEVAVVELERNGFVPFNDSFYHQYTEKHERQR